MLRVENRWSRGHLTRLLPLVLGLLCLVVLWQKSAAMDWAAVTAAFGRITPMQWLGTLTATCVSFWALAQYDLVAHRHFGTATPDKTARRAGAASIALGQTLGFGPVVGAGVRWHLMPGLGQVEILRITGFVTVTFFMSWALIASCITLSELLGLPYLVLPLIGLAICIVMAVLFCAPRLHLLGRVISMPTPKAALHIVALALVDLVFAGMALWMLLPAEMAMPLTPLLAAFVVALGCGMLGGTPGGVGPFELSLFALLPMVDTAQLAAALLAYRGVYYALPCLIAGAYLLLANRCRATQAQPLPQPRLAGYAEIAIAAQSGSESLRSGNSAACLMRASQTLMLFRGPAIGQLSPLLPTLKTAARRQNRLACLYKISARDAVATRRAGWTCLTFASEAVLSPAAFDLNGRSRRQLRRSLRKVAAAGVSVDKLAYLDLASMAEVNAVWAENHGGERGFTMGRYCPDYLRDKPVFAAYQNGKMIAFASGVESDTEMSLDVMRHLPGVPSGTMQLLVKAMIDDAAQRKIARFSLAAIPHQSLRRFAKGAEGLARFKQSFAPDWQTLYVAAPSRLALAICALDIWWTIRHPPALPAKAATSPAVTAPPAAVFAMVAE